MPYCDVIVDIAVSSVDRLFTYEIPEDARPGVGSRVRVPFGNRFVDGFVLALKDEPGIEEAAVKPIQQVLSAKSEITGELVALSRFISEKYYVCLSEALRLMIPAELRGGRVREKAVKAARIAVPESAFEDVLLTLRRAPKQAEVFIALRDGGQELSRLSAAYPGAADAVNSLKKKGLVELYELESLRRPYGEPKKDDKRVVLTPAQHEAVEALKRAADESGGRFLLLGITGSGKTEVYIRLIRHLFERGKTAIVLVPEIALTPQMVDWFRARFGDDAAVMHSRLSAGERYDEWRRIRRGDARVVIGARSAVFAPLENIGAIIVDEEHEGTYLSEHRPQYDAREIAKWRCDFNGGVLVLGSATPSIQTFMKTMPGVKPENRLTLLELGQRATGQRLPSVEIVDMRKEILRGNASIFSGALKDALQAVQESGMQAMLFINRRGHSTFVSCRSCGYVERCVACDVSMTYHSAEQRLKCHYCGAERKPPIKCPSCGSGYIKFFGIGTQRVEEEVKKLLPTLLTLRMDNDTTQRKGAHEAILSSFRRGDAQVLIGTQMIAKGLDFPKVTLVGVVAADLSLNVPDYRSVERTFQLLTQVAGRAGRAEHPGRVIVQSYDPEHYGIRLAAKQDYRAFYHEEVKIRRRGLYPPYTALARILCTSEDAERAQAAAEALERKMNEFLDGDERLRADVVQMRALEAPLKMIRGEARWQVFIKLYARGATDEILAKMEKLSHEAYDGVKCAFSVNPANML